jgi:hypothetical protein
MNEYIYEVVAAPYEGATEIIKRTDSDGNEAWIPTDPANSDFQAYLASLEAENVGTETE